MAILYSYISQSVIRELLVAKNRIAEGMNDSAQSWIDTAIATILRTVVQDVEAEPIPAPDLAMPEKEGG